jgi:hypothetical protein
MKKRQGVGSFLFQLLQTARLAGFTVVVMSLAVVLVYYILRFFAHLLHIR